MKTLLRALLLPLLAGPLLAGCCANDTCNCQDLFADALYFDFARTGANAFAPADVDTVYLLRYGTSLVRPADSAAIIRAQGQTRPGYVQAQLATAGLDPGTVALSNTYPFAPGTTGKLRQYTYKLRVRLGNSPQNPYVDYSINNLTSAGRYRAEGCCTCYENLQKTAFVNGQYQVFTEPSQNRPVVLTLTR